MNPMTDISVARQTTASTSPWSVFFVAGIAVFLVSMGGTVLFAAFGALRNGCPQSTAADLSWVLNAYTVVYAALLVGGAGDRARAGSALTKRSGGRSASVRQDIQLPGTSPWTTFNRCAPFSV